MNMTLNEKHLFYNMEKGLKDACRIHGVQGRIVLVDNFFRIFQIIIFCFVADICNTVHDVEAIHDLC